MGCTDTSLGIGERDATAGSMTQAMGEDRFVLDQLNRLLETGKNVSHEILDSVGDVVDDFEAFGRQFRYSEAHGLAVPVLLKVDARSDQERIPLPIYVQGVADAEQIQIDPAEADELNSVAAREAGAAGEPGGWRLDAARPEEGRHFLLERAVGFIRNRFAARSTGASPMRTTRPFRVITRAGGLRVHYSAIYGLQPKVFGAWTTPLDGVIGGGTWMFGVDGDDQSLRWDSGHFPVPPLTEAVLVVA
jgi:hypothetical protein